LFAHHHPQTKAFTQFEHCFGDPRARGDKYPKSIFQTRLGIKTVFVLVLGSQIRRILGQEGRGKQYLPAVRSNSISKLEGLNGK
jgi:hypothetical protein